MVEVADVYEGRLEMGSGRRVFEPESLTTLSPELLIAVTIVMDEVRLAVSESEVLAMISVAGGVGPATGVIMEVILLSLCC